MPALRLTCDVHFHPDEYYPEGASVVACLPLQQEQGFRIAWKRYEKLRRQRKDRGPKDVAVIIGGKPRRLPAAYVEYR